MEKIRKTEDEWRKPLTPEQYEVARGKGTEPAFTGKYHASHADGKHIDEFAEIEALDNGKPVTNARKGDLPGSINILRYTAGWAARLNGETISVSSPGNWHAYTLREPVGVVGQITPWNFQLMMAAGKSAPALTAGCTIVLKPAEQTRRK